MLTRLSCSPVLRLIIPLSLLAASAAVAQSADSTTLRRELNDLKQTARDLNTKIESLEHQLAGQPEPAPQAVETPAAAAESAPTPASGTGPQECWGRVTRGMTFNDVEALLGHPQRTMDLSPKTLWYYSYRDVGSGSVVFTRERGVIDWQAPPFNTWW